MMALVLAVILSFFLPLLSNPDPLVPLRMNLLEAGGSAQEVETTLQEYRHAFLLDQDIPSQFVAFAKSLLQGDLGTSVRQYPQTNIGFLLPALVNSLLQILLLPLSWGLALLIGTRLRWGSWLCIPLGAGSVWLASYTALALVPIILCLLVPVFTEITQSIRKRGHFNLCRNLGIPEQKMGSMLSSSVLRAHLPAFPLWISLGMTLVFFVDILSGSHGLASLWKQAQNSGDFSLMRSSGFLLVFLFSLIPGLGRIPFRRMRKLSQDSVPAAFRYLPWTLAAVAAFTLYWFATALWIPIAAGGLAAVVQLPWARRFAPQAWLMEGFPVILVWAMVGPIPLPAIAALSVLTAIVWLPRNPLAGFSFLVILVTFMQWVQQIQSLGAT